MIKITLSQSTSDRDFAAIKRFAEKVEQHWPEFSGANVTVERDIDELGVSVSGCNELNAAELAQAVANELDVLKYSASVGW